MKLTGKQLDILHILKSRPLPKNREGNYFLSVPTFVRRSGELLVSNKELETLRKKGLIDENKQLTEFGKATITK